jgi:hypothetical protein
MNRSAFHWARHTGTFAAGSHGGVVVSVGAGVETGEEMRFFADDRRRFTPTTPNLQTASAK